jgi:hypothetical protein
MNKYFDRLASTEIQRLNTTPSQPHTYPKVDATPKAEPTLIELHNLKHLISPEKGTSDQSELNNKANINKVNVAKNINNDDV